MVGLWGPESSRGAPDLVNRLVCYQDGWEWLQLIGWFGNRVEAGEGGGEVELFGL